MSTDYIMRMIEEFFRILRNILMKRENGQYEMAREGLSNLSKMITGLGIDQLKSLGEDGVKYFFNLSKPEDIEKVFCAGKMFKEDALINEVEGKFDDMIRSYEFSLSMFEIIKDKNSEEKEEIQNEIINIKNILQSKAG